MGQEKKQTERKMWAAVYRGKGKISLEERKMPKLLKPTDAIINVTLTTICSSDIHILKGAVPKAREGVILGHEFVGKVIETGSQVKRGTGFLKEICKEVKIPVYGIGGITPENVSLIRESGAKGACIMSGFMKESFCPPQDYLSASLV